MRITLQLLMSVLLSAASCAVFAQPPPSGAFVLEEATIDTIHAAFASRRLTCVELVEAYLARIEAYDQKGPALNAILSVNPAAQETAAELDRRYASGASPGGLHCIPVVLKDNYDTFDLPTTGGSVTLASSVPPDDATVVQRIREAGAIILAKANLHELARGGTTVSSLGGQTRNPYDRTRTPGGSSGGTGAAIAASFAVVGTGSDTLQSIRSPASAQSLVGVRPTHGLISRDGIIPISPTQDEVGPITRTVQDAARMLNVMAGYDPADPVTAFALGRIPESYTDFLDKDGLRGARIGLLEAYLGNGAPHREVNAIVQRAMEQMVALGATLIPIEIPRLAELTRRGSVFTFEYKHAFNAYLASLSPQVPVKTLEEFIARAEFHDSLRNGLVSDNAVIDGLSSPEYLSRLRSRTELRQAVMNVMANNDLDAILYPLQQRVVGKIGDGQLERNGALAYSTGFPAITFPGGFSEPSDTAPDGVPVGIELLGSDWSEPQLLRMAYAFQEATRIRKPPSNMP